MVEVRVAIISIVVNVTIILSVKLSSSKKKEKKPMRRSMNVMLANKSVT